MRRPARRAAIRRAHACVAFGAAIAATPALADVASARLAESIEASEYRVRSTSSGLQAPNRAHGLRTWFDARGVRIADRTGAEELFTLALIGLGRGDALAPVPPGEVASAGARVEIRRPGVVEWYENSPAGLEQGFTLAARPAGEGPLAVEVAVAGARVERGADADRLVLATAGGRRLDYGHLAAWDATGRTLASRYALPSDDRIRLVVDDAGAVYPLTIDPIVTGGSDLAIQSNQVGARLGYALAGAGDVNGDGYDDVIVGALNYDAGQSDEGAAFVFHGSATGLPDTLGAAATVIESNQASAHLGWSVAGAGDVNGDGYDDVIVGAPEYDGEGAAFVFLGGASGLVGTDPGTAAAQLTSTQAGAAFGFSVAGAGDVNGDGYADVIVGARLYETSGGESDEGAAFVFVGSASGVASGDETTATAHLQSDQQDAHLGTSVAGAGDVNGDGYDDVIVGAQLYDDGQMDEGAVFVFAGGPSGVVDGTPGTAATLLQADQGDARLGFSVAGAGDVNGDGYDDVIVGAPLWEVGNPDEGGAFVFLGSASGIASGNLGGAATAFQAGQNDAQLGYSVAGGFDGNGDGYDDIAFGAPFYEQVTQDEGVAAFYPGSASGISIPNGVVTVPFGQLNGHGGFSVAGAGDVDGDGFDDMLVGVPDGFQPEANEGFALVYYGGSSAPVEFGPPAALNTDAGTDPTKNDRLPSLATDGSGTWVAVWGASDAALEEDLLFARSTDGGTTWSAPALLNTNGTTDTGSDLSPHVATDGGANWVVVWASNEDLGGIGTDYDIFFTRSTDGGATWSAPAALNTNASSDTGLDDAPRIETDGLGSWVVVWSSDENLGGTIGGDPDIFVSRSSDAGATWTAPAVVNDAAGDSPVSADQTPDLATDRNGHWIAVWNSYDFVGFDIYASHSSDGGATWTGPQVVTGDASGDLNARVATDGLGRWGVVLDSGAGGSWDVRFARSIDDGATWLAPVIVEGSPTCASPSGCYPQVATDRLGTWLTIWHDVSGSEVRVSRSLDAGATWLASSVLDTEPFDQSLPVTFVADGSGTWIAAWSSESTLGGTIGTDADILFARGIGPDSDADGLPDGAEMNVHGTDPHDFDTDDDGAGDGDEVLAGTDPNDPASTPIVSGAPLALNTNAAGDSGDDSVSSVATDESGNWVAVWASRNDLDVGSVGDYDIHVARSSDGGTTWSAPAALNTNSGSDSGDDFAPRVATDGAGNWVAVWHSVEDVGLAIGPDSDILVSRSSDAGASWTAPAALNSTATSDLEFDANPEIATDGAGNWMTVWFGQDPAGVDGDSDVYFSVSTNAGLSWTPVAAVNDNAAVDSVADELPCVATDGAGNWLVAWQSYDSMGGAIGSDPDILVARSSNLGASWTPRIPLNSNAAVDSNSDSSVRIETDRAGRWVAMWDGEDGVSTALSLDVGATWTPRTVLDAAGASSGQNASLATDRTGTWLAVWSAAFGDPVDFDVVASYSGDGGATWSTATVVSDYGTSSIGYDLEAQVATDRRGTWLMAWSSADPVGTSYGNDYDLFYAIATGPDRDGDGLTDGAEVNVHGTDPANPDSDGDGLSDGDEVDVYGTDPNDADSDDDGIDDAAEIAAGTDPSAADADVDGVCDGAGTGGGACAPGPDNCPLDYNPAQEDVDADGPGDPCDACPNDASNACDPLRSAAMLVGPAGGMLTTPDGSVSVILPAGALATDTMITITDNGAGSLFELSTSWGPVVAIYEVNLGPDGQTFLVPVTVVLGWDDVDDDGFVDATGVRERRVRITKDQNDVVKVTGGLLDRCIFEPGPLASTGAECDRAANTFAVDVLSFSDFALVLNAQALPTLLPLAVAALVAALAATGAAARARMRRTRRAPRG